ncbi:hypothetical protein ACQY0O_006965 [Thecaphora frezii]
MAVAAYWYAAKVRAEARPVELSPSSRSANKEDVDAPAQAAAAAAGPSAKASPHDGALGRAFKQWGHEDQRTKAERRQRMAEEQRG